MNMDIKEFYDNIGGDYNEALSRFENDDIIKMFLKKYLNDSSFSDFISAVNNSDMQKAFLTAHTLKGVTGSMAFKKYNIFISDLVEKLRCFDYIPNEVEIKIAEQYQFSIINYIEKL